MAMSFPDELFYLATRAAGEIELTASMFPASQVDLCADAMMIKVTGSGAGGASCGSEPDLEPTRRDHRRRLR